ncbi:MAG: carbamoyl transferase, partial [Candidatus Atribacteria bacterium]|nr:carbamoyl transferase [Candidatus Atribacteria bacterium]
ALHDETGIRRFCLAGGSALNCVGNGKLLEQDFVDEIFIQPAASDDGTAIGAAYLLYTAEHKSRFKMEHAYWGPEYSNEEVEEVLKKFDFKFDYYDDIEGIVAELLNRGEIVGRFQGRMEIGPRALGNRSILANPTIPEMADEVNIKVKHREPWRPFAPSMLEESAKEYLKNSYPSPFMILSSKVIEEKQKEIPAVVHVDGTTRAQTVTKKINQRYYRLISEFEKVSGVPVILNTSLNDRGEPIVCSPFDAINTFKKTGLTYLAIENYMVRK